MAEAQVSEALAQVQQIRVALGLPATPPDQKGLADVPDVEYDTVVALWCGDACDRVLARRREAWDFPAPKDLPPDQVRAVRNGIEAKVKELLAAL